MEAEPYANVVKILERAHLSYGDSVMPGEAGAKAQHWGHGAVLTALSELCRLYRTDPDWSARAAGTVYRLSEGATDALLGIALEELAKTGWTVDPVDDEAPSA